MILDFPEINAILWQQLAAGNYEQVLADVTASAFALYLNQNVRGHALFLPAFDEILAQVRHALLPNGRDCWTRTTCNEVIVYLATEVYETGGHTRFIEDMAALLPEFAHVLMLTDVTGRYREAGYTLGGTGGRLAAVGISTVILRGMGHVNKVTELDNFLESLRPRAVCILAHHFDSVAQAGVGRGSARSVLFYHHGDYSPSLGATRKDVAHVDFTEGLQRTCKQVNNMTTWLTPMTVRGSQRLSHFGTSQSGQVTGLTRGGANKYFGSGLFSYSDLLSELFSNGVDRIHHVGYMPPDYQELIIREVSALQEDRSRLVFHGEVVSVCAAIHSLRPDFYLTSHPCGGGKSMLEAMSSGLPIVSTRKEKALLEFDVSRGSALVIDGLHGVTDVVSELKTRKAALSDRVYETYQGYYSDAAFRRNCLAQLEWAHSS